MLQFRKLVGDHHLYSHPGRIRVPGDRDGAATRKELLATPWRNTCEPNWSKTLCKIDGSELPAHQGCDDFSFGSGIAVHVRRLHRHHEQVWPPRIGRKNRRVLRQRSSGIIQRHPRRKELVNRKIYHTRRKAIKEVTSWIELCYNQTRLHSSLGYRTPNEVHQEWRKTKTAA